MHIQSGLWLGTPESYSAYASACLQANAVDPKAFLDMEGSPSLLTREGNVGIINIAGSLISGKAGWKQFFGLLGYGDIQDAVLDAAGNDKIKAVLFNVDSGGGAVAGVQDTASIIAQLAQIKPVITFTGGMMASAALWLGASSGNVIAAETAQVGSVGTLIVAAERSKQLEEQGITVNVIRAGRNKALANPYEPLSEAGREQLQAQADSLEEIFVSNLLSMRGGTMTVAAARKKYGEGRMFVGAEAAEAGLVDLVAGFSDAYRVAEKLVGKA